MHNLSSTYKFCITVNVLKGVNLRLIDVSIHFLSCELHEAAIYYTYTSHNILCTVIRAKMATRKRQKQFAGNYDELNESRNQEDSTSQLVPVRVLLFNTRQNVREISSPSGQEIDQPEPELVFEGNITDGSGDEPDEADSFTDILIHKLMESSAHSSVNRSCVQMMNKRPSIEDQELDKMWADAQEKIRDRVKILRLKLKKAA